MTLSLSHGRSMDVGHIGLSHEQLPSIDDGPIDLRSWFGPDRQQNPIELEIGSGKGTFLIRQAQQTPHTNYIGLEYAKAFWRYGADRCRRRGLDNVRLVCAEAGSFVRYYVPDASLGQVHIYFPDPWPKKRHHKRRLIQAPFLRELHTKLQDGGRLHIATDHPEYYQWITEHTGQVEALYTPEEFHSPSSTEPGELVGTNFERKYRTQGRAFHTIALRKLPEG